MKVELVADTRSTLGEGSIWDDKTKRLIWVDIENGVLHQFDPESGQNQSKVIGDKVTTVVPKKDGNLLLGLTNDVATYTPQTGDLEKHISIEGNISTNRLNDGKCDPVGRFWIGSFATDMQSGQASLYRVDTDFSVSKMLTDVTISNGIVWSHDHKKMYYIDTTTFNIYGFDFNRDDGSISQKKVVFQFPETMGFPDGMTIDNQDRLWVAMFAGYAVVCVDPVSGEIVQKIDLPVKNATSCAFGGKNLDELYITTARIEMTKQELSEQPIAGGLFRVKPGTKGVPANRFG